MNTGCTIAKYDTCLLRVLYCIESRVDKSRVTSLHKFKGDSLEFYRTSTKIVVSESPTRKTPVQECIQGYEQEFLYQETCKYSSERSHLSDMKNVLIPASAQ